MDVSAVAVVDGATEVMAPPRIAERTGATCVRSCSWFQPSPSITSITTRSAAVSESGIHAGLSAEPAGLHRTGMMSGREPDPYRGSTGDGWLMPTVQHLRWDRASVHQG